MVRKKSFAMLETLWREHVQSPFPEGLAGQLVAGVCVVSLDTLAAGCIDTFLSRAGKLDHWRTALLGLCYHDLAVVAPELEGEMQRYIRRLEQLTRMILEAVRDETNPA